MLKKGEHKTKITLDEINRYYSKRKKRNTKEDKHRIRQAKKRTKDKKTKKFVYIFVVDIIIMGEIQKTLIFSCNIEVNTKNSYFSFVILRELKGHWHVKNQEAWKVKGPS